MSKVPAIPVGSLIIYESASLAPLGSLLHLNFGADQAFALRVDDGAKAGVALLSGPDRGRYLLARDIRGMVIDVGEVAEITVTPSFGVLNDISQMYGLVVAAPAAGGAMELYLQTFLQDTAGIKGRFLLVPLKGGQSPDDPFKPRRLSPVGRPDVVWRQSDHRLTMTS